MRPAPVSARVVATPVGARCCATGCGDKIKSEKCWRVDFADGSTAYLEDNCVEWFVNDHPDYGHPFGGADLFKIVEVAAICDEHADDSRALADMAEVVRVFTEEKP